MTALAHATSSARRTRGSFKFRSGSFQALVVKPEEPLADWLAEAKAWVNCAPRFFSEKPVVVDVSGLSLTTSSFISLVQELERLCIRILGIEGADPTWGKQVGFPRLTTSGQAAESEPGEPAHTPAPSVPVPCLVIDLPVRSGQTIVQPDGDLTIVGSVASGAEVIAAGSIHIYGTLRGRALAGAYGNQSARIFCRRLEAELLAINGHYSVADELEPHLRETPVHVWLAEDTLKFMTMD